MMKIVIIFTVFLFGFVYGETKVSQCIRHDGELPISTQVDGCVIPPCKLPKGKDGILNIVFKPPHTIKSLKTLATAYLGPVGIPYDLGEASDTCKHLNNTSCPVLEKEVVVYTMKLYIDPIFPAITVTIEIRIVNEEDGEVIACFRLPVSVVNGSSRRRFPKPIGHSDNDPLKPHRN